MAKKLSHFEKTVRPLAEALLDYALTDCKKYGVTDAEVSFSETDSVEISVEKGRLVDNRSGVSVGVSLTLYAGARMLSFSDTNLSLAHLQERVLDNAKVIMNVPENKAAGLLEPSKVYKGPLPELDICDKGIRLQDAIEYTKAMEGAALAQPGIKGTRSTSFERSFRERFVMASNGFSVATQSTMNSATIQVVAERGDKMEIDYEYQNVRHFKDMVEPETVGEAAAEKALSRLGGVTPKSRDNVPVILSQLAAAQFFGNLCAAFNGYTIYKGLSFFKDRIGERVVSQEISLLDNPLVPKGIASRPIDGTGLESKPLLFIENGVLNEYCSDLETSRLLGREPIGRENGTTNVIIQPSNRSVGDLLSDIKDGIYISSFSGGKVSVNTGEHSREAHGFLIRNGIVTDSPLCGFAVVGNLREMFNNVQLANDTPPMPNPKSHLVAPTTRLNGVKIAGL